MYLYSFIQLVVFISYIFYISKDKKEDVTKKESDEAKKLQAKALKKHQEPKD